MSDRNAYLPGHGGRTARMLSARSAAERAAFVPDEVLAGARVVDLGCGPGTLTVGLAERIGAGGRLLALDVADEARGRAVATLRARAVACPVTVVGGSAHRLPVADAAVDLVFAHALVEHLVAPVAALVEIRRVLRPGGVAALVSSDWSGATIRAAPGTAARPVREAVDGYRLVRRRTGADPDAGARLATWAQDAGLVVTHHDAHHREDIIGAELARYIADRLPGDEPDPVVDRARSGADAWAHQPSPARVRQRWVEVLAVTPACRP